MLSTVIETMLVLIEGLMGQFGTGAAVGVIDKILAALVTIVPIIAASFGNFLPSVQNIIANLQGNGNVTQAQLIQLDALSVQVDQAFENAATAAGDPA